MKSINDVQKLIYQIQEELPNVEDDDISSLVSLMKEIGEEKKIFFLKNQNKELSLTKWGPHSATIEQLLNLSVEPIDITKGLHSFRQYAESKQWTVDDNLDERFLRHMKYLIDSQQIRPTRPIVQQE